jgi:hypothetical protein
MMKLWTKFSQRKKEKTWKTDFYFGIAGSEMYRGHMTVSGAIIVEGKLVDGEVYYLRDICGNVLVNRDESGNSLIQNTLFTKSYLIYKAGFNFQ